ETYRPGDRIVAWVKDIDREARGPQVILSRSDAKMVEKLFETEVPEIYEGIVRIVAVAREPGARSKIAVTSRDADVDPVGACVGMKGSRVQAVVQELRGEKIDIVPFDRDPARYVIAAIPPAEGHQVLVDEAGAEELAAIPGIGSVEAATKLKESAEATMERIRQERIHAAAQKTEPLTEKERLLFVRGVGDRTSQLLDEAGYRSVDDLLRE